MYVCICNAVKEAQIKNAIAQGHDSLEALQNVLDVATCCGGCQPMVEDYLAEHHAAKADTNKANLYIQVA